VYQFFDGKPLGAARLSRTVIQPAEALSDVRRNFPEDLTSLIFIAVAIEIHEILVANNTTSRIYFILFIQRRITMISNIFSHRRKDW